MRLVSRATLSSGRTECQTQVDEQECCRRDGDLHGATRDEVDGHRRDQPHSPDLTDGQAADRRVGKGVDHRPDRKQDENRGLRRLDERRDENDEDSPSDSHITELRLSSSNAKNDGHCRRGEQCAEGECPLSSHPVCCVVIVVARLPGDACRALAAARAWPA